MKEERRNFYRLLNTQPDAPLTVIKTNHRVLMQKLQQYADQGLADEQASFLNTAVTVLQDPVKRTVYDHQLLKQYSIRKLSLGSFAAGTIKDFKQKTDDIFSINRRNYYRILQVQPDAPIAAIIASYRALLDYPFQNINLLDEAFAVLANPVTRARYDTLLAGREKNEPKQLPPASHHNEAVSEHETATSRAVQSYVQSYTSRTLQQCVFCYAPYANQLTHYQNDQCQECGSPLPVDRYDTVNLKNRFHRRIITAESIAFYLFWPESPHHGVLQDLSPNGARFLTSASLGLKDIIKIDAPGFKAVAEVAHTQPAEGKGNSIGARFLTIKFTQDRGNFIVANA